MSQPVEVALVTGAGQGIGWAVARVLAQSGMVIALNDISAEACKEKAERLDQMGLKASCFVTDVADYDAVESMVAEVEQWGPIRVLVNNAAAAAEPRAVWEATKEEQERELVTLRGTLYCTRHVAPAMKERGEGRIINVSSISGRHGQPTRAVYSAAKAGIEAFTKTSAKELGPYGIRVNAVCPGAIETPRFRGRGQAVRQKMSRSIALGRFGSAEDVAGVVHFLTSPDSDYINGAVIEVDGGFGGFPPPSLNQDT